MVFMTVQVANSAVSESDIRATLGGVLEFLIIVIVIVNLAFIVNTIIRQ